VDTPLNNKNITFFLILLIATLSPKSFSFDGCDNKTSGHACIEITVNSQAGETLQDIVVYLEPMDGQVLAQSSKEVVIGQRGKSFTPYISVSQVNAQVNFTNQDDITHHIYSAGSDNKFSFKIRAGQTNNSTQFSHASEVAMGCNIHDWMSGYLLVLNTPYFAKTDKVGQVKFEVTQQGQYRVVVWHPQMQSKDHRMDKSVLIESDTNLIFTLDDDMAAIPLQKSDDDFDFLSDY